MSKTVYLLSLTGQSKSFELQDGQFLPDDDVLAKEGFGDGNFVVCLSKPQDYPPAPTASKRVMLSSVDELATDFPAPPIPQPTNKDSIPPKTSIDLLISTTRYFPGGTSELPVAVYLTDSGYWPAFNKDDKYPFWCSPSFPRPYSVQYLTYWLNTWTVRIAGPQTYQKAITTTEGMEKARTETLSGEVGVKVGDLSLKMSKSVSNAVTVSVAVSSTDTYSFTVPEGKYAIWTLWQLVEKFVFVDEKGQPIQWSGTVQMAVGSLGSAKFKEHTFDNRLNVYVADLSLFDN